MLLHSCIVCKKTHVCRRQIIRLMAFAVKLFGAKELEHLLSITREDMCFLSLSHIAKTANSGISIQTRRIECAFYYSKREYAAEREHRQLQKDHRNSADTHRKMSKFLKLKPLFDRVLVQRFAAETKSKGGLLIPEKAMGKIMNAKIVSVGPGLRTKEGSHIPSSLKAGDSVLLPEYGGTKVEINNEEMFIFKETDILGVWEK
ncbi:hypothetical protein GJ496_008905 [Pomphorhynchus laevis]|nr:hypothetical protein GJ496_008905 [Pomphorhynchus laevis]